MSLSNSAETHLLNLLFNNLDWPNIGDVTGIYGSSTTEGYFYVSLHTADPTETGNQTTSECAYTNYARVAVERTDVGWTVSGNSVSNAAILNFPQCGTTGSTATHFAIGRASSGTGQIILYGPLTSSLAISSGITPSFSIGTLVATAD